MNKRFLRLVLYVMRRTEKKSRSSMNYFLFQDRVVRWNGLICCVAFTLGFLMMLLSYDFDTWEFPAIICFGGLLVYLWFLTMNAWHFYWMRRKKAFRKARKRIRWMLNATPYCFVGLILISLLALVPTLFHGEPKPRELVFIYIAIALGIPFGFTWTWIVVATTPFHTGYGGRPIRDKKSSPE